MFGYKRVNRNVLSRCLKTSSDCADVTCVDRSFQMLTPEAGSARLPTVDRRTAGTSNRSDVEDRSRRLEVMSASALRKKRAGKTKSSKQLETEYNVWSTFNAEG